MSNSAVGLLIECAIKVFATLPTSADISAQMSAHSLIFTFITLFLFQKSASFLLDNPKFFDTIIEKSLFFAAPKNEKRN